MTEKDRLRQRSENKKHSLEKEARRIVRSGTLKEGGRAGTEAGDAIFRKVRSLEKGMVLLGLLKDKKKGDFKKSEIGALRVRK